MLACSKASGSLDIIREARNAKDNGIRGFFGAEPGAAGHTALAKRARQPQNAGQGADVILLFRRKLGKRTVLRPRFGTAMVTDRKSEEFPIFVAPSGGNGESKKELARGSLRRVAGVRIANPMQASRSK